MEQRRLMIGHIPAILWGETADRVYLSVHGQGGSKEEAERFAGIVCARGWQVLSIDLPGQGERGNEQATSDPWHAVPDLESVIQYRKQRWGRAALQATSIGAWFSMLAFGEEEFERCLFVSPVLDMERLIGNMMKWASVSEEMLRREREIRTDFGQTLSWEYLSYVREHPILKWNSPTAILYAGKDNLTERCVVDAFCSRFHADLTVMEEGEHWFHTPEQLAFLDRWWERRA